MPFLSVESDGDITFRSKASGELQQLVDFLFRNVTDTVRDAFAFKGDHTAILACKHIRAGVLHRAGTRHPYRGKTVLPQQMDELALRV